MKRRTFLATAAGVGASALAGCVGSSLPASTDYDVGMSLNSFEPDTIEVHVGETVVWGNGGSRGHTVTAYDDGIPDEATYFASGEFEDETVARDGYRKNPGRAAGGLVAPGETYSHTFEVAGTFAYFCIPHEVKGMVGSVEVLE